MNISKAMNETPYRGQQPIARAIFCSVTPDTAWAPIIWFSGKFIQHEIPEVCSAHFTLTAAQSSTTHKILSRKASVHFLHFTSRLSGDSVACNRCVDKSAKGNQCLTLHALNEESAHLVPRPTRYAPPSMPTRTPNTPAARPNTPVSQSGYSAARRARG